MNQKRQAFCEAYLLTGNAAEAAKRAGYSERTARSIGQRLLTFVDVQEYLERRNQEIRDANTAQVEEVREFWTSVMRDNGEKTKDRLRASELLAKAYGEFSERSGEKATEELVSDWIDSIPDAPHREKYPPDSP